MLDPMFLAVAVPAVIFAGISKGGFGSGAAFAATPLLALIVEPAAAVGLMLPLLMLMDVGALKPYWRKWAWPESRVLILGAIPGIALGTLLFGIADPDLFRILIGLIAIGFVLFRAAIAAGMLHLGRRRMRLRSGYVAGAAAGLTSFISHAGGPPAAIFLLSRGLGKTQYQATTVLVFWAVNLIKLPPYLALGVIGPDMWVAWLVLAPVALFGVWLGVVAHKVISERIFFGLTHAFLLATGAKLIWDALG